MSDWSAEKEEKNWIKHRIWFEEADTIFDDPLIIVIDDPDHSNEEDRYIAIGQSDYGRLIVLSYTVRGDGEPWLISAREAEPRERRRYVGTDTLRDGDEMRTYYDFSEGVRGKHYRGRSRTLRSYGIEMDVAEHFPTSEDVNRALRMLIAEGRVPKRRNE